MRLLQHENLACAIGIVFSLLHFFRLLWASWTSVMETHPIFAFSALPHGKGGEDLASPLQYKRGQTNDNLCDKLKAVQVTPSKSESPLLSNLSTPMSYASMLLNPLSHYGSASTDDSEFTEEDCFYSTGKMGPKLCFSDRVKDKIDLEWRCAIIIKLIGKTNTTNELKFMSDSLNRK